MKKKIKESKNIINFLVIILLKDRIKIFLIKISVIENLIMQNLPIRYFMEITFLTQL